MKKFNRFSSQSLHGKTATHDTTKHSVTIKKTGEHLYKLYKDGVPVGTIHADSENAALRSMRKKGYSIK